MVVTSFKRCDDSVSVSGLLFVWLYLEDEELILEGNSMYHYYF